ncbi:MAG: hypothetical protein M5U34_39175 [Chloroflexi bacterium]|nr:hypothetical protein [Chloroflexota bacterium]
MMWSQNGQCGVCRSQLIGQDKYLDVKVITPEVSGRGKLSLKIDQIRALQQDLNLSAYEARTKVAILKRFDAATDGAANAFLKTLEEPPSHVILLPHGQRRRHLAAHHQFPLSPHRPAPAAHPAHRKNVANPLANPGRAG